MNKWLYIICCIPLFFGCKDSGDGFDPAYENNLLVWGSDTNGEKYECCWVETVSYNGKVPIDKATYKVFDFHPDFSLTVQTYFNDEYHHAVYYTYSLGNNMIDLDQRLSDPKPVPAGFYYRYSIEGDELVLKSYSDDTTGEEPYRTIVCKRDKATNYPIKEDVVD